MRAVRFALLCGALAGCAPVPESREAPLNTVLIERRIELAGLDGSDVEIPAGRYEVEAAEAGRLRLKPRGGGTHAVVQARGSTHTEATGSPVALVVDEGDTTHIALLMPDRTVLEAADSASAVRSRAAPPPQMSALQIRQAYSNRMAIARQGAALQSSGTLTATPQDLNIFATPITEVPAPLAMQPAAGSYQASCVNLSQRQTIRINSSWTITTLSGQCRNTAGQLVEARLNDPQLCGGDISNNNGVLQCHRPLPSVLGRALLAMPGGSWQQTCRDGYHHMQSHEFRAQCRTVSGEWRYTSLNTSYPCASVSNDNGWLSCDTAPLPRGRWRGVCREASLPLPNVGFSAICMRPSDRVWQRTSVGPCTQEVDALDGHLVCGPITGLPEGNWVGRCRPVNWDPAQPAITVVCRNNDQSQSGYRVTMTGCNTPLKLHYDGTGREGFTCT